MKLEQRTFGPHPAGTSPPVDARRQQETSIGDWESPLVGRGDLLLEKSVW